ncbi:MAG: glycine/betaine ABC transporter substrate-binding protein, partial [Candidatus Desulforudis sp.]|nr:glycine/betaine ABC transporter substrate-binding protein [Desulforudis sp.]
EKAPDLYNFCKNFKMNIEDTEEFLYGNQEEGKDLEDLARAWIEEHRDEIDAWLNG